MKLYPACKKQFKPIFLGVLSIILLSAPLVFSYAQTANNIRDAIDQKNAEIAKLEEQIRGYQVELDNLEKQKSSLSVSIKQRDLTKKKLITDISVTQKKIDKTNLKIER